MECRLGNEGVGIQDICRIGNKITKGDEGNTGRKNDTLGGGGGNEGRVREYERERKKVKKNEKGQSEKPKRGGEIWKGGNWDGEVL